MTLTLKEVNKGSNIFGVSCTIFCFFHYLHSFELSDKLIGLCVSELDKMDKLGKFVVSVYL